MQDTPEKKIRPGISLTPEAYAILKRGAANAGVTMSAHIERMLREEELARLIALRLANIKNDIGKILFKLEQG